MELCVLFDQHVSTFHRINSRHACLNRAVLQGQILGGNEAKPGEGNCIAAQIHGNVILYIRLTDVGHIACQLDDRAISGILDSVCQVGEGASRNGNDALSILFNLQVSLNSAALDVQCVLVLRARAAIHLNSTVHNRISGNGDGNITIAAKASVHVKGNAIIRSSDDSILNGNIAAVVGHGVGH